MMAARVERAGADGLEKRILDLRRRGGRLLATSLR